MLPRLIPLLLVTISAVSAEREHKVHNIVLYPDKHSWCQNTPIQQVVASSGYKSVTIDNIVCVGACFSYSIPRTQPSEPGEEIGPYCDSCQPSESKCYHVTLQADADNLAGPPTLKKRVQIITNCSCTACDKLHRRDCAADDEDTEELPAGFYVDGSKGNGSAQAEGGGYRAEEVPELLAVDLTKRNDSHHHHHHHHHFAADSKKYVHDYKLTSKLLTLLKDIQEKNGMDLDKREIKDLIKMILGSEKRLNDKNLMEFVNYVNVNNTEDFELDLARLKEILSDFQRSQGVQTEIDSGLTLDRAEQNNADIERDIAKLTAQFDLPDDFGLEGSRHGMNPLLKGSHVGMGIHKATFTSLTDDDDPEEDEDDAKNSVQDEQNSIEDDDDDSKNAIPAEKGPLKFSLDLDEPKVIPKLPHKVLHHHESTSTTIRPHHHVGERQHLGLSLGRLVAGPHGSMAFAPDFSKKGGQEKLDLDTDHLQPNAAGTVISYENPQAAVREPEPDDLE